MRSPIASTTLGKAEMEERAPSSWRPPWFDTTTASQPVAAAIFASSTSRMPFRISLPGQIERIHSTSFQLSEGSNWPAIHCDSVVRLSAPGTRSARLPKEWRLPISTLAAQTGLVATSMALARVSLGGTDSPFLMSIWRWPWICRSSVSTSAEHFAALARSTSEAEKPRSRMT